VCRKGGAGTIRRHCPAPRFPKHNSASFGRLPVLGVGYLGKVPMSKVPILASFDFAEILMLTASILVVAAITFVF
jgi:hypothetical protein